MRTDVCQDGSGSVFGRSQMTPRSPLECCQTIGGTARLGMRRIQHLAMRKNLGNLSNGSCHSLGVQVSHTDFAFDAFNIQETAPTLLQCWFLNYCTALNSFRLQQREMFTSGSAEVLLHPDSFRSGNLRLNPYIFISLLRTSACWMFFELFLNSWKRTNVFGKCLIYQLTFQQDRAANSSFISSL